MRHFYPIALLMFILSLQSCASGYTVSDVSTRSYVSNDSTAGVTLNYKYNILTKKYAKKERKKEIKVLAVKIENHSDTFYTVGRNLNVQNGSGFEYSLLDSEMAFSTLKQKPATYLFYLLLTPLNLQTIENKNGFQEAKNIFPIGLILGPAITGGNMIVAGSANKKFKADLESNNVLGKTIKPGETLDGLLIINSATFESLRLKLK
ncbi:MAG: hypothetical protein R3359_00290 [Marinirhabdus sp.]|nr:hypothetical protein [Marinirhabdus sp.]